MLCGLGMPFLVFGAWIIIGRIQVLVAVGILVLSIASTLLYVFLGLTITRVPANPVGRADV